MPLSTVSSNSSDERENTKAGLKAWWAGFTRKGASPMKRAAYLSPSDAAKGASGTSSTSAASGSAASGGSGASSSGGRSGGCDGGAGRVFGVPLRTSLKYASVAISMAGPDGNQYVWGYIPAVVAKLGLYLKENATEVEGVFRIAGSQKRMKELQELFERPPKYGKNVDWTKTPYSVHDAASVLRRYLNHMPEPIVPLHLYSEFRNVMVKRPFKPDAAIKTYRLLIQSSPPANQYLLLYVLDLLAVFARKSGKNLMTSANLAVIFQPADEHQTAVQVLEFLIEHQDHFVLGLSPPPPPHIKPEELTAVSRVDQAAAAVDDEALLPSDSDEDLGELQAHEGGGAAIARKAAAAAEADAAARRERKAKGGFLAAAIGKLASTGLVPPPLLGPSSSSPQQDLAASGAEASSTDMHRSVSASSAATAAAENGTFLEGREVGGPADAIFGGRAPASLSSASGIGSSSVTASGATSPPRSPLLSGLIRSSSRGKGVTNSNSKTSAPSSPEASTSGGVRRSKTTPTKKAAVEGAAGKFSSSTSSPRAARRKRKHEATHTAAKQVDELGLSAAPASTSVAAATLAPASEAAPLASADSAPPPAADAPAEATTAVATAAEATVSGMADSKQADAATAAAAPKEAYQDRGPVKLLDASQPMLGDPAALPP
ncbi:Rho GTPase activation protein [Tilletiaria anomala UBC 951]|uniref:Rho GTPase activation protein n=1 Tax=Tilletiaria anomala (strain ATCC 24038 / CBS 436.72 / UBC 951) TaxID=1037660 RepID=A0A066VPK5_TILAU|nr:Rho GTPase activation protein [Tilletiaria anomala UBC 951]KDN40709.1 Rho GTPase activation protein [Tilletiaria anomala UBC 951]